MTSAIADEEEVIAATEKTVEDTNTVSRSNRSFENVDKAGLQIGIQVSSMHELRRASLNCSMELGAEMNPASHIVQPPF